MISLREMPKAILLVNAAIGEESHVLDELKRLPEVESAHIVYGVYDIVVQVSALDMDVLDDLISNRMRKLKGVRSTLTLVISKEYIRG